MGGFPLNQNITHSNTFRKLLEKNIEIISKGHKIFLCSLFYCCGKLSLILCNTEAGFEQFVDSFWGCF
jgi:hypothetical protein